MLLLTFVFFLIQNSISYDKKLLIYTCNLEILLFSPFFLLGFTEGPQVEILHIKCGFLSLFTRAERRRTPFHHH